MNGEQCNDQARAGKMSEVTVVCSHCQSQMKWPTASMGRTGACPICFKSIVVRTAPKSSARMAAVKEPEAPAPVPVAPVIAAAVPVQTIEDEIAALQKMDA